MELIFRNSTIQRLMPRYLHVKAKAKPEEIDVFHNGMICFDFIIISFLF